MLLKEFEDVLKNIEADSVLMSYGNNKETINSILSIVNLIQSASTVISTDRGNDMFTNIISNKILELEGIVVAQGCQRLQERGINIQQYMGNATNIPTMPMYNNPMFYANMYNPMQAPAQPQMPMQPQQFAPPIAQPFITPPPQPQYVPIQPNPQQQPTQQPITPPPPQQQTAPQPVPPQAVPPQAEKTNQSATPPQTNTVSTPKSTNNDFVLPGAGGASSGESAAGRDYLLKLLQDK